MHLPPVIWFFGQDPVQMKSWALEAYPKGTIWVLRTELPAVQSDNLDYMLMYGQLPTTVQTLIFITTKITDISDVVRGHVSMLHLCPLTLSDITDFDELNYENVSREEFDQRCTFTWKENRAVILKPQLRCVNDQSTRQANPWIY